MFQKVEPPGPSRTLKAIDPGRDYWGRPQMRNQEIKHLGALFIAFASEKGALPEALRFRGPIGQGKENKGGNGTRQAAWRPLIARPGFKAGRR